MQRSTRHEERAPLSRIVLSTSCAMVGVCATVISLIKLVEGHIGPSHADKYLALVLSLFLISAVAAYLSIRHSGRKDLSARLELVADVVFLIGLVAVASIGLFFAYEII